MAEMSKARMEYIQNYNKNNYKQLNFKIPSELYDEFLDLKNEYGSAPKILETSLNALKNFKNLAIENENLKSKIDDLENENLKLKNDLNEKLNANFEDKESENLSENKLILEVVDENERLKNEIIQLKNFNTELKNNLNEKSTYNITEDKKESNKMFLFFITIIMILLVINIIRIFF